MKHFLRVLAVIGAFLGTFILAVCAAVVIIMKGPSRNAAELFTLSLKETSALKWIPDIFFSDEEIQEIIDNPEIDAVHLVTPPSTHAPLSIRVLNAGKHCGCTIPMGMDNTKKNDICTRYAYALLFYTVIL